MAIFFCEILSILPKGVTQVPVVLWKGPQHDRTLDRDGGPDELFSVAIAEPGGLLVPVATAMVSHVHYMGVCAWTYPFQRL